MLKKCLLIVGILTGSVYGKSLKVPENYRSIQSAIDAAKNGDTVLVGKGHYFENINFLGKNIIVASYYAITHDPMYIDSTIIDGIKPRNADTASCVLFIHGEDSTATLEGFTLTRGTGTLWKQKNDGHYFVEGGGVLVDGAGPTIKNNKIYRNEAVRVPPDSPSAGGGGIRVGFGSAKILGNVIMANSGAYGAGICLFYASAEIRNNIICFNGGAQDFGGGGLWIAGDTLSNAMVTIKGTRVIIENNTIVNNASMRSGGGMEIIFGGVVRSLKNNILWGNVAPLGSQIDLSARYKGTLVLATYNAIQNGWKGENNIKGDPQFADSNFTLSEGSPCIDAGDPDAAYLDTKSGKREWPSLGTARNDIGAYGGAGGKIFKMFYKKE